MVNNFLLPFFAGFLAGLAGMIVGLTLEYKTGWFQARTELERKSFWFKVKRAIRWILLVPLWKLVWRLIQRLLGWLDRHLSAAVLVIAAVQILLLALWVQDHVCLNCILHKTNTAHATIMPDNNALSVDADLKAFMQRGDQLLHDFQVGASSDYVGYYEKWRMEVTIYLSSTFTNPDVASRFDQISAVDQSNPRDSVSSKLGAALGMLSGLREQFPH